MDSFTSRTHGRRRHRRRRKSRGSPASWRRCRSSAQRCGARPCRAAAGRPRSGVRLIIRAVAEPQMSVRASPFVRCFGAAALPSQRDEHPPQQHPRVLRDARADILVGDVGAGVIVHTQPSELAPPQFGIDGRHHPPLSASCGPRCAPRTNLRPNRVGELDNRVRTVPTTSIAGTPGYTWQATRPRGQHTGVVLLDTDHQRGDSTPQGRAYDPAGSLRRLMDRIRIVALQHARARGVSRRSGWRARKRRGRPAGHRRCCP